MRYLGIDYGEKRIGVALSDVEGKIAFPHATISVKNHDDPKIIIMLREMATNEGASTIVLGLPKALDGHETHQTVVTRRFAEKLKKSLSLPVHYEDEIFTTRIAAQSGVAKKRRDAASAAIVLQSYLDRKNRVT